MSEVGSRVDSAAAIRSGQADHELRDVGQLRATGITTLDTACPPLHASDVLAFMEPFIAQDPASGLLTVDAASAAAAGIASSVILAAEELAQTQNDLLTWVSEDQNPYFMQLDQTLGPRLSATPSHGGHPCGDFAHPVPNFTPKWRYASISAETRAEVVDSLLAEGFHRVEEPYTTTGIGGGWTGRSSDYAKIVPYAPCQTPFTFRHQAQLVYRADVCCWTYKIQGDIDSPEPNPELPLYRVTPNAYLFPYSSWYLYVAFWHAKF